MPQGSNQIFLSYPEKRDVLFVLGAGASHPDGVPLQRQLLPLILSEEIPKIKNSEIGKVIIEFITDNFSIKSSENYPSIEAVFGFLDYFIYNNESLSEKYSNAKIRMLKEYLIILVHYVVNKKTAKDSKYYGHLWHAIEKFNTNVSITTLNYDTLLEHSFEHHFGQNGLLDYCIDLMNFESNDKLKNFKFWIDPRKPIHGNFKSHPISMKILKLHGSLNWKYCNCCNQTLLTTWDKKIDLDKGKFLGYKYPEKIEFEYRCPIDGADFQTLIMPPSYLKKVNQPVLNSLFSEAGREIRSAKRIIFVGYSLSDADIHIKALFKKNISSQHEIIVINRKNAELLKHKYLSLSPNPKFIEKKIEDVVTDENLMKELLTIDS